MKLQRRLLLVGALIAFGGCGTAELEGACLSGDHWACEELCHQGYFEFCFGAGCNPVTRPELCTDEELCQFGNDLLCFPGEGGGGPVGGGGSPRTPQQELDDILQSGNVEVRGNATPEVVLGGPSMEVDRGDFVIRTGPNASVTGPAIVGGVAGGVQIRGLGEGTYTFQVSECIFIGGGEGGLDFGGFTECFDYPLVVTVNHRSQGPEGTVVFAGDYEDATIRQTCASGALSIRSSTTGRQVCTGGARAGVTTDIESLDDLLVCSGIDGRERCVSVRAGIAAHEPGELIDDLGHLFGANDDIDSSKEAQCEFMYYEVDIPTCRGVSRNRGSAAGARCYASAAERYAACLTGRPIPELDTRSNKDATDSSGLEYWEELTGLTGLALILYLILSEGSRLFPPRNLIPIP